MAKRWTDMVVDGRSFKVDTKNTVEGLCFANRRTVDDCYEKPSQYKREIFADWQLWFLRNNGFCTVSSYNCMMFTLDGVIKVGDQLYRAYITKTRQELTPIV